jgi:polyisoprenoid-binding protein YceI
VRTFALGRGKALLQREASRMDIRSAVVAACVAASLPLFAVAATPVVWRVDPIHTRASFSASHFVISRVDGHIPIKAMTLATASGSLIPTAVDVTLDVANESTDNDMRDNDLKSPTYFDIGTYPTAHFHANTIAATGPKDFTMTGDLTIKDVTKSVTIPVHVEGTIPDRGGVRVVYTAQFHIDRRDYHMVDQGLTGAGVLVVGNDVTVGLSVDAVTKDPSIKPGI